VIIRLQLPLHVTATIIIPPIVNPSSQKLQSSSDGPSRFRIGTGRKSIGEEAYIAISRQFRQIHTNDKSSYAKEARGEGSIAFNLHLLAAVNLSIVRL
jgi:hypothetical protein